MEVDDIIRRLARAAKLYGGSHRDFECDQGSRARDSGMELTGISDVEHAAIGNRAGRLQRS